MDSQPLGYRRLLCALDREWQEDKLSFEEIQVPLEELPDPDEINEFQHLTLRELENKWFDLTLEWLSDLVKGQKSPKIQETIIR